VLFDLDGTLLDTTPLIIKSFQHAFATHYQRSVSMEDIQPFMGKPLRAAMEVMAPGLENELISTYRAFNDAHHDSLALIFDGVHDTVKNLYEAGVILAVVTSKSSGMARRGLRLFNMEQYFSTVVGLDETIRHKPDTDPVLMALRKIKLSASDCIMVGDSPHDIHSAKGAGVKTAAVKWTNVPWGDVLAANPDYTLDTMADLLPIALGTGDNGGVLS
jgi:pyrophosphatase PpaX